MDPVTPSSAAPAQPETPAPATPTTAVERAVVESDFPKFRDAKRAEEQGKPLPVSPATPEPPADAMPPAPALESKPVSKRQQQINDYERTIAEQHAELARLRAQTTVPPAPRSEPPTEPVLAPAKFPAYATYLEQHPDASLEDWMDARDVWRDDRRTREAHARADTDRLTAAQRERVTNYTGQITAAQHADPAFLTKVTPEVLALKPFNALLPGEPATPLNAIAEEILSSPVAPAVMLHFSQHPEELRRFATLAPRALIREFGKLEARLEKAEEPPPPPPKTVTDFPAPPVTLGSRPADPADPLTSAVQRRDFASFREAKRNARRT